MKKIILSVVLFMTLLLSHISHAQTWNHHNYGLPKVSVFGVLKPDNILSISHSSSGYTFVVTQFYGVYRILTADLKTTDPTKLWQSKSPAAYATSVATAGNNVYVSVAGMGIYRSTDNGNTWSLFQTGIISSYLGDESYLVSNGTATGNIALVFKYGGFYYCTPSATSWTSIVAADGHDPLDGTFPDAIVQSVDLKGTLIYIGTNTSIWKKTINSTINYQQVITNFDCVHIKAQDVSYSGPATGFITDFYAVKRTVTGSHPLAELHRYAKRILPAATAWTKVADCDVASKILFEPSTGSYPKVYTTQIKSVSSNNIGKNMDINTPSPTWIPSSLTGLPISHSLYFTNTFSKNFDNVFMGCGNNQGIWWWGPSHSTLRLALSDENTAISIYPNPATSSFRLTGNNEDNYEITIVDLQGKTLYTGRGLIADINNNLPNISNWTNGIYLVRINNTITQETSVEKLVKQ